MFLSGGGEVVRSADRVGFWFTTEYRSESSRKSPIQKSRERPLPACFDKAIQQCGEKNGDKHCKKDPKRKVGDHGSEFADDHQADILVKKIKRIAEHPDEYHGLREPQLRHP